jgi:hypothetical protein
MRPVHGYLVVVYLVLIALGAALLLTAHDVISSVSVPHGWDTALGLVGTISLAIGLVFLGDLVWRSFNGRLVGVVRELVDKLLNGSDEESVIDEENSYHERARPGPRTARDIPAPHTEPGPLAQALDRLNGVVEELVLNCRPPAAPADSFPSPDDATPLVPLDRGRFLAELQDRFAVAVVQIADVVGRAGTVRELSQYNAQVGAVLAGLHEDVLREIVRQQPPVAEPAAAEPPPKRRRWAAEPPGAWARKYRGMRPANR